MRWGAAPFLKRALPYTLSLLLILLWWAVALKPGKEALTTTSSHPVIKTPFHTIDRSQLKQALNGDSDMMIRLIDAWDKEAVAKGVRRLSDIELETLRSFQKEKKEKGRFFPQTYAAACFMLGLGAAEQIVALPQGLRKQKGLLTGDILSKIPEDAHRFNTERLALANPDGAFIAAYSDPGTIQALRRQKIPAFILDDAQTLPDIMTAIRQVGHVTDNEREAEQLCLFVKAALLALDNRVEWLIQTEQMPHFLLAYEMNGLHLPTRKTVTGQLLERMGIPPATGDSWTVPLTKEYMELSQPDFLLIASERDEKKHIPYHVQLFATQHVVLAYYDILYAIIS